MSSSMKISNMWFLMKMSTEEFKKAMEVNKHQEELREKYLEAEKKSNDAANKKAS